jgi:thymidylate kinase
MRRINTRGGTELYESFKEQVQVREKYLEIFERLKETDRVFMVDAGGKDPEEVAEEVWGLLK